MLCPLCQFDNPAQLQRCRACGAGLKSRSPEKEAASDALPQGALLAGTYAIEEVLGQGGFGITYRCHDRMLERRVAVKEFFPSGCRRCNAEVQASHGLQESSFREAREQFLAEARTLARCHHGGIVGVYAAFEANATAYMVMELLHGHTLSQLLDGRGGCMNEAEALNIIERVGEALSFVHAQNLLHRDIKPDNIMVCNDGRVMLIDFGTARETVQDQIQGQTVIVTPGYAPLEQYAKQAKRGAFTDVYSLAATLYHLLTGQMPPAASDRAMGVQLRPVRELNPQISQNVARAVEGALQMEIARRPQSVRGLLELLRAPIEATESTLSPRMERAISLVDELQRAERDAETNANALFGPQRIDLISDENETIPAMLAPDFLRSQQQARQIAIPMGNAQPVKLAPPRDFSATMAPAPTAATAPAIGGGAGGNVRVQNARKLDAPFSSFILVVAGILGFFLLASFFVSRTPEKFASSSPSGAIFSVSDHNRQSQTSENIAARIREQNQKSEPALRAWNALPVLPVSSSTLLPANVQPEQKSAADRNAHYRNDYGAIGFSPDGKRVAYIDDQATLRVLSLPARQVVRSLKFDKNRTIIQTLFSSDNKTLAVLQVSKLNNKEPADYRYQVDVRNLRTGKRTGIFVVDWPEGFVRCKNVLNNGQLLLQAQFSDKSHIDTFLWNPKDDKRISTALPQGTWTGTGTLSPDEKEFVLSEFHGILRWLNWKTGQQKAQYTSTLTENDYKAQFGDPFPMSSSLSKMSAKIPLEIKDVKYASSGSFVAIRNRAAIEVLDSKAQKVGSLTIEEKGETKFSISPDGKWVAASGSLPYSPYGKLLWNVETGKKIRLEMPSERLLDFNFSPDGKQIYGMTADGKKFRLVTWNINDTPNAAFANSSQTSFRLGRPIRDSFLSVSRSAQRIALATEKIIEIRQQNGTLLRELDQAALRAQTLQFSPDARLVSARNSEGAVRLWNAETGKSVIQLPSGIPSSQDREYLFANYSNPHNMAFSPDNKFFAYGRFEGALSSVELWSLGDKPQLLASLPQTAPVTALTFSPNNQSLICGNEKGILRWYDVPTGRMRSQSGISQPVLDVVFTTSNFVVVGTSKTISYGLPVHDAPQFRLMMQTEISSFFPEKLSPFTQWDVSDDGKLLVKSLDSERSEIWQLDTGRMLQELRTNFVGNPFFYNVAFSDSTDGTQIVSFGQQRDATQVLVTTYRRDSAK